MRITNTLNTDQAIDRIRQNLARMDRLQTQLASGKKFDRISEAPVEGVQVARLQRSLRALDQYAKNRTTTQVRLGAEEAVAKQLDDLLRDARNYALSLGRGDPPFSASQIADRQKAATQITRLLDDAIALGNTKIGNEFILAGQASTTPAFDTTPGATYGDYRGDSVARTIEVDEGRYVPVNHTGDQYVGPAIAALRALRDAVDPANSQTEAQVDAEVQNVFNAAETLQVSRAETAAIASQLATADKRAIGYQASIADQLGRLRDIDQEETVAKVLSLQTTIEASYSATSRLLSLSLTEYLR
ncbi:MAG: flagellin [Gemmatimonadales bacterium]